MALNSMDDCLKAGMIHSMTWQIAFAIYHVPLSCFSSHAKIMPASSETYNKASLALYIWRKSNVKTPRIEKLVDDGQLEPNFSNDFRSAMFLREGADYNSTYSEQSVKDTVDNASAFIIRMKRLIWPDLSNKYWPFFILNDRSFYCFKQWPLKTISLFKRLVIRFIIW